MYTTTHSYIYTYTHSHRMGVNSATNVQPRPQAATNTLYLP